MFLLYENLSLSLSLSHCDFHTITTPKFSSDSSPFLFIFPLNQFPFLFHRSQNRKNLEPWQSQGLSLGPTQFISTEWKKQMMDNLDFVFIFSPFSLFFYLCISFYFFILSTPFVPLLPLPFFTSFFFYSFCLFLSLILHFFSPFISSFSFFPLYSYFLFPFLFCHSLCVLYSFILFLPLTIPLFSRSSNVPLFFLPLFFFSFNQLLFDSLSFYLFSLSHFLSVPLFSYSLSLSLSAFSFSSSLLPIPFFLFHLLPFRFFFFFFYFMWLQMFWFSVKLNHSDDKIFLLWQSPVGWGCKMHWLHLCIGIRPSDKCPGYDTK